MKFLWLILTTCILNSSIKSQNIDSVLANFYKKNSFEKTYVQFDNSRYSAGQTIWYKAYLMSGIEPSLISKNFYIDWYDDNGQLVSSTITPIIYCYSSGSFTLPGKYTGKFIQAVAYTKWMRNFDSSYFFQQKFQVISSENNREKQQSPIPETTVQFLTESGNLLLNKQNIVAFKGVNQYGLPESVEGYIKNDKGDIITSFKSIHDGMGKFLFVPVLNEVYMAEWKDKQGAIHKTDLPVSTEEGVNLIVESGISSRIFHIQRTKMAPESMKKITLVAQMNGVVIFKAKIDLTDKESISSSLPISKISSGILQLTVFDENRQPVCERIIFVKNADYLLNASVTFDTLSTEKRGKNVIDIELKDTTIANLSLSITDSEINNSPDNTIISQLLLKGDLAGNIYNAAYYFSSTADSVADHLDLVMLTNGWRRFNWKKILNNPPSILPYAKDSSYQKITGRFGDISFKKNKNPETINLIFVSKDSSFSMMTLPILDDGSFYKENVMTYDTSRIYYDLNGMSLPAKSQVLIENDFFKVDPKIVLNTAQNSFDTIGVSKLEYLLDEQKKADIIKQKNTLKDVIVYSKEISRIKQLDNKYATGNFTSEATAVFDMYSSKNSIAVISIFDFLDGKIPGLTFSHSNGNTTLPTVAFREGVPSFYLNESYIPTEAVQNIDLNNVAYIKVFSPPFVGGFNGSGGAIVIYTKKGPDINPETNILPGGMAYKTVSGYAPYREFYSPGYAEKQQSYSTADLRTTLLWNPWINLDKFNNKIKISFYNNDVTHSFRLILEGMDSKGKLIHLSKILK